MQFALEKLYEVHFVHLVLQNLVVSHVANANFVLQSPLSF
jgi:hypothetical protein